MSWTLPYTIAMNADYQKFMAVGAVVASLYPLSQLYYILKAGNTASVSWLTWVIVSVSNIFWLIYGLMVQDLVILLSCIVPIAAGMAIVITFLILPHHRPPATVAPRFRPLKPSRT